MHLEWSNEYVGFLLLLIPLLFAGWLILRANDREKAHDKELEAEYSNYGGWKQLNNKWAISVCIPVALVMVAASAASAYPELRLVLAYLAPLVLFTWAPAIICTMVLWGSRYDDWRSYLTVIWRPLLISTILALVCWRIQGMMDGLPALVKWAQIVLGMALSPLYLRLSGFFELDDFRLEPKPKLIVP